MAAVSSEEAGATAPAEDGDTESGTDAPDAVTAEAVEGAAGATAGDEAPGVTGAQDADGTDADDVATGAVAGEAVEIPKQQSAEAAADNEAGEGARR
ncbi:hypothetical protein ACH4M4_34315 [Streptomyces sp. NPDC017254]|uniref:hypothetical protein n=1 Tax=unclassified Streptomyces TaxID=2593676 RepID=UPI003792475E